MHLGSLNIEAKTDLTELPKSYLLYRRTLLVSYQPKRMNLPTTKKAYEILTKNRTTFSTKQIKRATKKTKIILKKHKKTSAAACSCSFRYHQWPMHISHLARKRKKKKKVKVPPMHWSIQENSMENDTSYMDKLYKATRSCFWIEPIKFIQSWHDA